MRKTLKMIRNRVIEEDVRDRLAQDGLPRGSIRFSYMELIAIQRPGWVQVFNFHAHVTGESGPAEIFGVVRDDERNGMEVFFGEDEDSRKRVQQEWSTGLITLQRNPISKAQTLLLVAFVILLSMAILAAIAPV